MSGSACGTVMLGRGRSTPALIASARRSTVQTLLAVRSTGKAMFRLVASEIAAASAIQAVPK
jgi:hypothetical protein